MKVDKKTGEVIETRTIDVFPHDRVVNLRHAYRYERERGEVNDLPSCTVPDMSLGVREILQRYAQGRPLSVNNNLMFTGDDFTPDVRKMDLVELEELRTQNAERINELNTELGKIRKSKTDAAEKKKLREEIMEDLKSTGVHQLDIEEAIQIAKSEKSDKKKNNKGNTNSEQA